MEGIVTAFIKAEPIWGRIRQQNDESCDLVQDGRRGPRHDVLYLAQMTDEFIRMLIGCSRIRPGKAPISNVMKWLADGGIDLLSSDLDELAQYVAQILGAEFWRGMKIL